MNCPFFFSLVAGQDVLGNWNCCAHLLSAGVEMWRGGGVQVAGVSVPLSGELRKCFSMCPPPREDDVVRTDCESDKTFLGKVRYGLGIV